MTVHRPGQPGDLPSPELLWARWALLAVLEATTEAEGRGVHRTGHWISGTGLHLDDAGCTWWTLYRSDEDHYVLYGEDESSGVKWHEPRIDMLAGAPRWLPYEKLRDLLEGWELGCVYWYENGSWARAPYPEGLGDDGLHCGMSRFLDREEVLGMLADIDRPVEGRTASELLGAAEGYRLTPDHLKALAADDPARDLPAMRRALAAAGLAAAPLPR
ncbi:hypothetical protein ACIA6C_12270 [Streptomyces sp. NPDC051578]|uniref:hypothetical protein n=1 Tax=Streptomyces sp. NPDC051578 TaxID=3365662 RepID=UPI0037B07480